MFFRRPMVVVFLVLVLGIWGWRMVNLDESPSYVTDEAVCCIGVVEEIQVKPSGYIPVLGDVHMTRKSDGNQVEVEKVLVYLSQNSQTISSIKIGQIVKYTGTYSDFQRAKNPGEFSSYDFYQSQSISGNVFADTGEMIEDRCDRIRQSLFVLRQRTMKHLCRVMNPEDAGVVGAMVLGEKSQMGEDTKTLYQKAGISHILAISGLHVSILGLGVFEFLRRYLIPMKKAVLVTIGFLLIYGAFTGFSVATVRAIVMTCCMLMARYWGKSYDMWSAWALSGIINLVQEPLQLFQSGFLLSYITIGGIHLFQPVMEVLEVKKKIVKEMLSGTIFFVVTLPVILYFFYEVSPYTVVVNILILPTLSLVLGVGFLGCIVVHVSPVAGEFLLATTHYILKWNQWICEWVEKLPLGQVTVGRPSWSWIMLYYLIVGLVVIGCYDKKRKWLVYAGAGALLCMLVVVRQVPSFCYIQLDVGQGDCACILHGDKTYLVDGGSSSEKEVGKYKIKSVLKYYGRNKIDAVFITHCDEDHTNGIMELVEAGKQWRLPIQMIIMPDIENQGRYQDDNYTKLQKQINTYQIPIVKMKTGDRYGKGDLAITCLHPSSDYSWETANDYSLTLDITYDTLHILTTGDLEMAGEQEVIQQLGETRYDILKVGHHGSKTSSSDEFLKTVMPQISFISCGENNRYGHPHQQTLEKLKEIESRIYRTDVSGAIVVKVDEKRIHVREWGR